MPKPKIRAPGEADAERIKRCKIIAAELADSALSTIRRLNGLSQLLLFIDPANQYEDIKKLQDRIARLRELENAQDLQSWQFAVDRAMDAAWQRLP